MYIKKLYNIKWCGWIGGGYLNCRKICGYNNHHYFTWGPFFFSVLAKIHRPVMETVWVLLGKFRENRKKRWRNHGEDISGTLGSFTILFRSDKLIKRFHWEENIFLTCDLRFSHELRGRKSAKEMIPGVTANDSVFHPPVQRGVIVLSAGWSFLDNIFMVILHQWSRSIDPGWMKPFRCACENKFQSTKKSATTWCRSFSTGFAIRVQNFIGFALNRPGTPLFFFRTAREFISINSNSHRIHGTIVYLPTLMP